MKNTVRWIIAVLMLIALALGLSCPSIVEAEGVKLPLDYMQGGMEPKADNWTYDESGKKPMGYKDSTIEVTSTRDYITLNRKGKKKKHEYWIVRIKISDPSQIRSAVSGDKYHNTEYVDALAMAKKKHAVVAMNGDFHKYAYKVGYVVRQGELIRDKTDNTVSKMSGKIKGALFDMLVIDNEGDLHVVPEATTDSIAAFTAETLEPQGRTIINTFNIGPALILDGQVQDVSQSRVAMQGDYQWNSFQQRIALIQTGPLEYVIVEVSGHFDGSAGMTLQEFADFIAENVPDAIIAYNLDGGGSTNLIIKTTRVAKVPGLRDISDIIYFASAEE